MLIQPLFEQPPLTPKGGTQIQHRQPNPGITEMQTLKPQSAIERVTGSVVTEAAATLLAATVGGPLAALLPILGKSIASERQRKRVEQALSDIDRLLNENAEAVRNLSDGQYKLINEVVLALFQTTESEKLALLRIAAKNALNDSCIEPLEATVLSRIIRDISAEEVSFLVRAFRFDAVRLTREEEEADEELVLKVPLKSPDARCVSGLISLGVLASGGGAFIDVGQFRFMPITAKLLAVVHVTDSAELSSDAKA